MGNGEWGMGNGEWGMGNGEWGMGNGEWGIFRLAHHMAWLQVALFMSLRVQAVRWDSLLSRC